MTVEDFGLGSNRPVATIPRSSRTIDAFVTMYTENVTGLAVVDEANQVVGNMSLSDLKEMEYSAQMFRGLYIPVSEFILRKRLPYTRSSLVWVDKYDTIMEVLNKFRKHRVHRVYILDLGSKIPTGVISLTDIMYLFSSIPKVA